MRFEISNLTNPFQFNSIEITNGIHHLEIDPFELMIFVTLNSIDGNFKTEILTF